MDMTLMTKPSPTVCGIEISARRAIFVFLRQTADTIEDVTGKQTQIKIDDEDDPGQVRHFCRSAHALFDRRQPDRIAIVQRKKIGNFASGGTTFKLEGLLQLYPQTDVAIVPPVRLRQFSKEHRPVLRPRFSYQKNAYLLACYLLREVEPPTP
jgi:hypothetical protein